MNIAQSFEGSAKMAAVNKQKEEKGNDNGGRDIQRYEQQKWAEKEKDSRMGRREIAAAAAEEEQYNKTEEEEEEKA
jgi:hypothetical protein